MMLSTHSLPSKIIFITVTMKCGGVRLGAQYTNVNLIHSIILRSS